MARVVVRVFPEAGALDGPRELTFEGKDEIHIGRAVENDVVLHGDLVSRRHARIAVRPGRMILSDLSENGVFIRGRRIEGPVLLKEVVPITIGHYRLEIDLAG
jgi:pSer/pThr/pTyr-binding forkhead associated (FHA) protein